MARKPLRSPRLARRAREKARYRIAFYLCALALFFGAILFLATRSVFSIKEVAVSGASEELRGAIAELARAELAGAYFSLIPKENAFAYPKRDIQEKILKQFPRVEFVRARLSSPAQLLSGEHALGLRIMVRERAGVALWCVAEPRVAPSSEDTPSVLADSDTSRTPLPASEGGTPLVRGDREDCLRIDASGVAFESAPQSASGEYRIIKEDGGSASLPPLGTRALEENRLAALLSFLRSLEALSLTPRRLTLLSGGSVAAEIAGGVKILAREGTDFLKQTDNLQGLLAEKDLVPRSGSNLRVDYIDLRHGNKLYFKPR